MLTRRLLMLLTLALLITPPATAANSQFSPLENMTLEQRVAQMFMVSVFGTQPTQVGQAFLRRWQPGGVILFTYNAGSPEAVTTLTNAFQDAVTAAGGPPLLIAVDQEGGVVARLVDGFTTFPAPMLLAAANDAGIAHAVGAAMAEELRAVGINVNLAPVADLETNPANPVIQRRSFGSDPQLVGSAVAGLVRGMQEAGVQATLKHFPGHGDSRADSHVELPVVDLPRERIDAVELAPFRAGIEAGAGVVMVAHIWYPALEPQPNLPATLSRNVVTGLLRESLGFDGLIMTDAMDMDAIDTRFGYTDAVVMAVQAGNDLIALGPHVGLETQAAAMQAVVDAVREGRIPAAQIDESAQRILAAKARLGLLGWQALDANGAGGRVRAEDHARLVEALFRAGVTVAYDTGGALPFDAERNVAIVYPATRAQIRNECAPYSERLRWVGVSESPTREEIAWAVDAAGAAENVVVFTQDAVNNPAQQTLVRALPAAKTIAVALRSVYDWTAFPEVSAYVITYSPLRPAVPAACAVLFGAASALGRPPVALTPNLFPP